jgi:hypothetical protein
MLDQNWMARLGTSRPTISPRGHHAAVWRAGLALALVVLLVPPGGPRGGGRRRWRTLARPH